MTIYTTIFKNRFGCTVGDPIDAYTTRELAEAAVKQLTKMLAENELTKDWTAEIVEVRLWDN